MDTQANHIVIGSYVRIAEWIGRIDDIAYTAQLGRVMLWVSSPKQVYRHSAPEWLEYHPDNADLIQPATVDDWVNECSRYMTRCNRDYQALFAMAEKPYEKAELSR